MFTIGFQYLYIITYFTLFSYKKEALLSNRLHSLTACE